MEEVECEPTEGAQQPAEPEEDPEDKAVGRLWQGLFSEPAAYSQAEGNEPAEDAFEEEMGGGDLPQEDDAPAEEGNYWEQEEAQEENWQEPEEAQEADAWHQSTDDGWNEPQAEEQWEEQEWQEPAPQRAHQVVKPRPFSAFAAQAARPSTPPQTPKRRATPPTSPPPAALLQGRRAPAEPAGPPQTAQAKRFFAMVQAAKVSRQQQQREASAQAQRH